MTGAQVGEDGAGKGLRVRWVTEDAGRPGGVEQVLRRLDAGLKDRGVDSSIHSWTSGATRPPERRSAVAWLAGKVESARGRGRLAADAADRLRGDLAADPNLVVVLDTGSLEVAHHLSPLPRWGLHVHWTPDLVLRPWRHVAGEDIPRVLAPVVEARLRLAGRANRRTLRQAPFVVSLTPSHSRVLRDVGASVLEVGNPVEPGPVAVTDRPREPVEGAVTIGFLGRLAYEKGPDVLLEALALLQGRRHRFRTLVAGVGPLEAGLRRRVAALGLDGVEFLGWVDDPRAVLVEVDVLVLPSRAEAVPLVLAEALAAGCLVVATDAGGGVRDILADGRLGTIVPTEDPVALAHGIEQAAVAVHEGRFPDRAGVVDLLERHSPSRVLDSWVSLLEAQSRSR